MLTEEVSSDTFMTVADDSARVAYNNYILKVQQREEMTAKVLIATD